MQLADLLILAPQAALWLLFWSAVAGLVASYAWVSETLKLVKERKLIPRFILG